MPIEHIITSGTFTFDQSGPQCPECKYPLNAFHDAIHARWLQQQIDAQLYAASQVSKSVDIEMEIGGVMYKGMLYRKEEESNGSSR